MASKNFKERFKLKTNVLSKDGLNSLPLSNSISLAKKNGSLPPIKKQVKRKLPLGFLDEAPSSLLNSSFVSQKSYIVTDVSPGPGVYNSREALLQPPLPSKGKIHKYSLSGNKVSKNAGERFSPIFLRQKEFSPYKPNLPRIYKKSFSEAALPILRYHAT